MGASPAPWTTAMLGHLADDRWYELDQVLAVGMRAVPPGRAMQERERQRVRNNRGQGPRPDRTTDQIIAAGARRLCTTAMQHLTTRGRVEREGQLVRRTA